MITNNKCNGDTLGSIVLAIKGGFPPYNVSWNTIPVQTGNIAINLKAGNYQATISDAMNDTILVDVTITEPTPVTATLTGTEPKCFGNFNGTISVNANGGTAPYSYLWSNGSILQNLDKLSAGAYQVTVKDSNGCMVQQSITLNEPAPLILSATQIKDVVCKSSPEGAITINISGGVKPYIYLWSTGDTTLSLNNIPDGAYILTVYDSNSCKVTGNYQVNYSKDNCENNVFIPQGFSPDGDGINDAFRIEGIEKYPDNHLRIYNRWGGMVFEETGYMNTWKGTVEAGIVVTHGDQQLPTGTYFYVLELAPGMKAVSGYFYISK